ncbi:hypothetical protein BDD12DRAFT_871622 [Trichophaea hybrida]|nr:hypothetical protein BDD12DRAFT_871622 [Trichophaea hybrida]
MLGAVSYFNELPNDDRETASKVVQEICKEDVVSSPTENKGIERGPPILAVAGIVVTKTTETTISIYSAKLVADIDMDAYSVTDQSCTSSSSSATGTDAHPLRVPAMPEVDSGVHSFQCPICFDIVSIRGESSWKRHVFREIRPYMCTFPTCVKLEHLFGSQHEWFEHELEYHRQSWYCNQCNQTFSSAETFKKHLQRVHPDSFSEKFLPTIIDRCTRPNESPQICSLCGEIQTFNRLQLHLGFHLQQIALFVLRVSEDLEEEGGSDVAVGVLEDDERELSDSTHSQPSVSVSITSQLSVPDVPESPHSRSPSPPWSQPGSEKQEIIVDNPLFDNAESPVIKVPEEIPESKRPVGKQAIDTNTEQLDYQINQYFRDFHNHSKECCLCRDPILSYQEGRDFCQTSHLLAASITKLLYEKAEHTPLGTFTVEYTQGWESVDGLVRIIAHYNQGSSTNQIRDVMRFPKGSQPAAIEAPPSPINRGSQLEDGLHCRRQAAEQNSYRKSPQPTNSTLAVYDDPRSSFLDASDGQLRPTYLPQLPTGA